MEFDIKPIDTTDAGLAELSDFLARVFPKSTKFTLDFLKWQYTSCPDGNMIGYNAYDGNKLISHFAALPLRMHLFGKTYKGAASINVSTDPDYRGKMLFVTLGKATIEYARQNGFDFMIAVPNANSTHAFLKYYDFQLVSPLTVKLGFGDSIYRPKEFNAFKIWTLELMEWRLNSPANQYDIKKDYLHSPISFFAKTINKYPLSSRPGKLSKLGIRPLNLYIGLGAEFTGKTYFNIPKFIKRPPFNLVFKDFTGNIPAIKKEDIFLQLLDLDTI